MLRPTVFTKTSLIALAVGVAGSGAYAQDNNDQQEVEEIIVTSTRRAQDILDVPYNITAISGDEIEGAATMDSAELLRSVPGVGLTDQGPRNASQYNSIRIRGLNVDSSNYTDIPVASVATVSTYVNETPVFANLALIDLERVEILRGPQGTLYGSGALGGTVKYFTRAPQIGEFEANVSADASNVSGTSSLGYAVRGVVNVPIGDTFAVRANVYWRDLPGITDYTNLYVLDGNGAPEVPGGIFDRGAGSFNTTSQKDADTYDSLYARISAKWEPSDNFNATLNYIHQDDEVGGRRDFSTGADGFGNDYAKHENGAMILEPSEREFDMGTLEMEVDLGFATLTSATSYYDTEGTSETDNTGFYANSFPQFYYFYPRPLYTAERSYYDKAFTQEVRLVSKGGETIDYVIGGYHQNQDKGSTQISNLVGFQTYIDTWWGPGWALDDTVFNFSRDETTKENAIFGEITWNVSDDFHITGGLRHYSNDFLVDTYVKAGLWSFYNGETDDPASESNDKGTLFKVNVSYDFADDDLIYAIVSEGYRRGGNNGIPTIGRFANDASWVTYKPDTITNYELGIKGTFNDIRYDVSVFRIDWNDPQLNTSAPVGSFFAVVNGDTARTQGIEIQLSGSLGENLSYSFGYAYLDSKLTADLTAPININTGLPMAVADAGAKLPGTPEHAINVAFTHVMPQVIGNMDLVTRVDGAYQSKIQGLLDSSGLYDSEYAGFSIWDLTATLASDSWGATIFVKNAFNVDGTTAAFTADGFGPAPTAEFWGSNTRQFITLPRTIGISIHKNF